MVRERELEDYLEGRPEALEIEQWVGRQVPLAHGIADLVGFGEDVIYVVELKAVKLEEEHVGQVLRYTYDVRDVLSQLGMEAVWGEGNLSRALFDDASQYGSVFVEHMRRMLLIDFDPGVIVPVLVGEECESKIAASMRAIGGHVWTWRRRGAGYSFDAIYPLSRDTVFFENPPEWVKGLWRAMVESGKEAANKSLDRRGIYL